MEHTGNKDKDMKHLKSLPLTSKGFTKSKERSHTSYQKHPRTADKDGFPLKFCCDYRPINLDAGLVWFGCFVRSDGTAVMELQPCWMNMFGSEKSLGVNIHMGPFFIVFQLLLFKLKTF